MIPNRQWLMRARRQMCGNYQDLCGIKQVQHERLRAGNKNVYTPAQVDHLNNATDKLSEAIDHINAIVELPKGS